MSLSTRDLAYLRQQYAIETNCNHCAQLALHPSMSLTTLILLYCPTHLLLPSYLICAMVSMSSSFTCDSQHPGRVGVGPRDTFIRSGISCWNPALPSKGRAPGPCPQVSRFLSCSLFRLLLCSPSLHHQVPQPCVVLYTCSSAQKALPPQHVGLLRPSLTTLFSLN